MGRNLPPGVSVGDLPGNRRPEPECKECGNYPDREALEDGYPLCEQHDTEEARKAYDELIEQRKRGHKAKKRREERNETVPKEHREKEERALAERYSEGYEQD